MDELLKSSAATVAAFAVAIGGGVSVIGLLFLGILDAESALPVITMLLGGATGYLWGKHEGTG